MPWKYTPKKPQKWGAQETLVALREAARRGNAKLSSPLDKTIIARDAHRSLRGLNHLLHDRNEPRFKQARPRQYAISAAAAKIRVRMVLDDKPVAAYSFETLAKVAGMPRSTYRTYHGEIVAEMNLMEHDKEDWWAEDSKGQATLLELIQPAKTSLHISIFEWTHLRLAQEVVKRFKTGVRVIVWTNAWLWTRDSRPIFELLINNGVPVNTPRAQKSYKVHTKLLVVDGSLIHNGSSNWTGGGVDQDKGTVSALGNRVQAKASNQEYNQFVYSPDKAKQNIARILAHCEAGVLVRAIDAVKQHVLARSTCQVT